MKVVDQRYKIDEKPEKHFYSYMTFVSFLFLITAGKPVFCYHLYYNDVFYVYDYNTYL